MSETVTPENQKQPPAPGRSPRWMRILLVISLALNLLIIGAVIGAAVTGGGKWQKGPRDGATAAIAHALSDADKKALRRQMAAEFVSKRDMRRAIRTEVEALAELMRSPEFSKPALDAQLRKIQTQITGGVSSVQALISERLSEMNANERAAYADRLEEVLKRHGKKKP